MAAMTQTKLFSWNAIEARSDLDRLKFVVDHLPEECLVQYLEVMRAHGRNDYPVRAMWNALLAGIVFEHESLESLLRELARNPSLMDTCGFDPLPIHRKLTPRGSSRIPRRASRALRSRHPGAGVNRARALERLARSRQRHRVGRNTWDAQRDDRDPARAAHGRAARLQPVQAHHPPARSGRADTIVHTEQGTLHCVCPVTEAQRDLVFQGFEADPNTLKYRCPAAAYVLDCQGQAECHEAGGVTPGAYGRIARIKLDAHDRRIFVPTPHVSPSWQRGYGPQRLGADQQPHRPPLRLRAALHPRHRQYARASASRSRQ